MLTLGIGLPGLKGVQQAASTFTRAVFERADLPPSADLPEELRDITPRFNKTRGGMRVSSALLPEDVAQGFASPATELFRASWGGIWALGAILGSMLGAATGAGLIALAGMMYLYYGLFEDTAEQDEENPKSAAARKVWYCILFAAGLAAPWIWLAPAGWCIARPLKLYMENEQKIFTRLYEQGATFTAESSPAAERLLDAHVRARYIQAENVAKDTSPVFTVGTATGALTAVGCGLAPDRGLPMNLSIADLSTHLLVLGRTGSGKTAGALRKLFTFWSDNKAGGALVLCGKGTLPMEFVGKPGYTLIAPGQAAYGLIAGLQAEDVADIISTVMQGEAKTDPFWMANGAALLRSVAVLQESAHETNALDFPWTLAAIRQAVVDQAAQDRLLGEIVRGAKGAGIEDLENDMSLVGMAYRFLAVELRRLGGSKGAQDKGEESKTIQGIIRTVDSWIMPILGHRDLLPWASSEEGVDPTAVCQGALIGLGVSSFKYGQAVSTAISQLVKARVYRAIRNRGDKWKNIPGQTPVLLMVDECQDGLIGQQEMALASQGRSLGARLVFASQNFEGIVAAIGQGGAGTGALEKTKALLGNFLSVVCFHSTPGTMEYLSERMGHILRRESYAGAGAVDFGSVSKQIVEGYGGWGQQSSALNPLLRRAEIKLSVSARVYNPQSGTLADLSRSDRDGVVDEGIQAHFQCDLGRVLTAAEADAFLQTPFAAAAYLMRGSVPRMDIIEVEPEFA